MDIQSKIFNKKNYIIFSIMFFSIMVTIVDAFIHPPYFTKIFIKIIFFIFLPILYFIYNKEELFELKKLFRFNKDGIINSIILGLILYLLIVSGYFIIRNFIDFGNVVDSLSSGMGITKNNYMYVLLYICIINSFLEEFFFRGFGFITLKKFTSKNFSYLYSSILFSIYHMGMMIDMFNPFFVLFLMICLVLGGFILNYFNDVYENIYPSWFFHMAIDFGIHTVGLILFDII